MFTGITTDIGSVQLVKRCAGNTRFEFYTHYSASTVAIGASISCNGCCMTVIACGSGWFATQASHETIARTTMNKWHPRMHVNLEQALRVGDELGGHFVFGHVDGVAEIIAVQQDGDSKHLIVELPPALAHYSAKKGSVALDGVSLTINEVDLRSLGVNIIPHTQVMTTLGSLMPGDHVNVEVDMLARYAARLLGKD